MKNIRESIPVLLAIAFQANQIHGFTSFNINPGLVLRPVSIKESRDVLSLASSPQSDGEKSEVPVAATENVNPVQASSQSDGEKSEVSVASTEKVNSVQPSPQSDGERSEVSAAVSDKVNSIQDDLKARYAIVQKSRDEGASFKQIIANVLAGEYDMNAVKVEVLEMIKSAPCVMFTWENSPSCKKAVEAFDLVGANVKIIRLDDPWDKGNPMRAELGKLVGRTSVPFVFIGGEYVGGYDGGTSDVAPGMVNLAFKGTLSTQLKEAGAL
eukprot:CAMPEP_0172506640 /NCGR_PEP_ID=MMETSP1066-20121228/196885_1 /TAXON_ID=671091 /ORGANISM="Coscinodiscus wailesii, Strain CCMP2513" /LENGTH=268 /DNA_ID=CAMNT_0013283755 /DNA_START=23 /DNA_END=829 /DNA_ORIENTATION=-